MSRIFRPYKSFPTQKYYKTLPEKEWFGQPNGVATLDENGKLVLSQIPGGITPGGDSHNKGWFATPDSLPTTAEDGDYAIVGSTDTIWVWDSDTSKWVNSGSTAGAVTKVNGKIGEVVLNAEDIETTEDLVLVGDAGTTLEAAIATVAQTTADNATIAGRVDVRTQFITANTASHTTTLHGILDIINNDSNADIKINGVSLNTQFDAKQDKLKAGDGIAISEDNTISATGATAGTVLSVNNIGPTEDGNVTLTINDIPNLNTDLTDLKAKVINITTEDSVTTVSGTLEIKGKSDTDIPTVDTGEKGQVLTNTIVVSDEIDTAKIAMSGNAAVKIESFDTSISAASTDTGLPTSKAVYDAIAKNGVLSDNSKVELQEGTTSGLLLMPNGDNYVKPELNQFVDYKIKIFAKSVNNTKFEKYSVNFFAINNNDTSIITSSPTCESVSFAGGALIDNVDVRANTEDATKIEFSVTTTSDNVVLYTSLNKTIINNII